MFLRTLMLLVGAWIAVGLLAEVVIAGGQSRAAERRAKDEKKEKTDKVGKDKAGKDKGGKDKDKAGKDKGGKDKGGKEKDKGGKEHKDKAGKEHKDKGGLDTIVKDKGGRLTGGKDKGGRETGIKDKGGRDTGIRDNTGRPGGDRRVVDHERFGLPKELGRMLSRGAPLLYKTDRRGKPLARQPEGFPRPAPTGYKRVRGEVAQPAPGIVFARSGAGAATPVEFKAGVSGKVVAAPAGGPITVEMPDGTQVQYLDYSEALVKVGDAVTPDTVLGKTGNGSLSLSINARDKAGKLLDPEKVLAPRE
jgi:murein DD-endopeptidase MepM/ murein hydrolase activator NlpD